MRTILSIFGTLTLAFCLPGCETGDGDGDGALAPTDCDDADPAVHPGAEEQKGDQIDNDCDGLLDCEDDELVALYDGEVGAAEVEGLCANWCEVFINGSVILDQTALTDLDDLSCVTEIAGDLTIRQNESLGSIAGLAALKAVGGNVSIGEYACEWADDWVCAGTGNPALTSFDGLQGLETVGGWLFLADNDAVVDPGVGFEQLRSVGGGTGVGILIDGHAAMTALPDFPQITTLGWTEIQENDALANLAGLSSLQSVESLLVAGNAALSTPLGLDALETAGTLVFVVNGNTSMRGLESLRTVTGALEFWDNDALLSFEGLSALESIGYWMQNIDNDSVTDMRGLDALTTIGLGLNLMDNDALVSVDGLESLTTLGGNLQIMGYMEEGNPALVDLKGLYGLETVSTDVIIRGNATLPEAEAWALVGEIETIGGTVTIEDNGG